jgi:hypothetical protein
MIEGPPFRRCLLYHVTTPHYIKHKSCNKVIFYYLKICKIKRAPPQTLLLTFTQEKGVDYLESYAQAASIVIFRLLIAIAAGLGLKPRTFDVGNAFANSDMKEDL